MVLLQLLTNFLFGIRQDFLWYTVISYAAMIFLLLFFAAQFILACMALTKRFRDLNENLRNFISNSSVIIVVASKASNIREIGKVFHKLCDAIETINETFTFPFILILAHVLVRHLSRKE